MVVGVLLAGMSSQAQARPECVEAIHCGYQGNDWGSAEVTTLPDGTIIIVPNGACCVGV
jgi:hypothetical protein